MISRTTMRRIAVINQKGGVGKTTTCANLGAALARAGQRVVLVDMDPQANLSLHLGAELEAGEPSIYSVLLGSTPFGEALRPTATPGLSLVASHIDLSGAELELAAAIGRESLLRDALNTWAEAADANDGGVDFLIIDCPPSLGLLSVNALAAVQEVLITLQTEFFALQGMSKLVEVVQLMRRRLNPELEITGILPCLYDSRLRLAREVLGEIRRYFPARVFPRPIRSNVKLAESPSYGQAIFDYAPSSPGAQDYANLAAHMLAAAPGTAGGQGGAAIIPAPEAPAAVETSITATPPASAPVTAPSHAAEAPAAEAPAAETLGAETLGAETHGAETLPPQAVPSQAAPAKAAHADVAHADVAPADVAPADAAPAQAAPAEAAPAEAAPAQAAPAQAAPQARRIVRATDLPALDAEIFGADGRA
ncbi:MAG: AAA family ATPase [Planctomycetota bacterium]|nr:AAA family ATPase [Planctomycetota bacterium]